MDESIDRQGAVAAVFDRAAPTYEQTGVDFFATLGRWLVEDAGLRPGERVLDVGCGRGAVTFPAAAAVGPAGAVTALDLAPAMLAAVRSRADVLGARQVSTILADAQAPTGVTGVTGPYDAVLSGLVLFFLPDPAAALRAYAGLLRAGGRLAISTFGADDPRWAWLREVLELIPVDRRQPGPTADGPFSSTPAVEALVEGAGFASVRSVERTHVATFSSPGQWWGWSWSHGMRAWWEAMPADVLPEARARVLAHIEGMAARDGAVSLRVVLRTTVADRA